MTGCATLTNALGQVRGKVEPIVDQAKEAADNNYGFSASANDIAQRIQAGEDVLQVEKDDLATFTAAAKSSAADIKLAVDGIDFWVDQLPEPK